MQGLRVSNIELRRRIVAQSEVPQQVFLLCRSIFAIVGVFVSVLCAVHVIDV